MFDESKIEILERLESLLYDITDELYDSEKDGVAAERAFELLTSNMGHFDKHINESDGDVIKRLLRDGINNSSSFNDLFSAVDMVTMSLLYEKENISSWLCKNREDFDSYKEYERLILQVDTKECSGYGFDTHYQKKSTTAVRIVLDRDFRLTNEFGFHVVTACPDISISDYTMNIGRPLEPTAVINDVCHIENYLEKTLAICLPKLPSNIKARYDEFEFNGRELQAINIYDYQYPHLRLKIHSCDTILQNIGDKHDLTDSLEKFDTFNSVALEFEKTRETIYLNHGDVSSFKDDRNPRRGLNPGMTDIDKERGQTPYLFNPQSLKTIKNSFNSSELRDEQSKNDTDKRI